MACQVIDWTIHAFGGGVTSNDMGIALAYAATRLLRLSDAPDKVDCNQIGKLEPAKYR